MRNDSSVTTLTRGSCQRLTALGSTRRLAALALLLAAGLMTLGCPGGGRRGGGDDSGGFSPLFPDADEGVDSTTPDAGPTVTCIPGQRTCDGNAQVICLPDGTGWADPVPCAAGTVCNEFGLCAPCEAGARLCQGQTVVECIDSGNASPVETCENACANGFCVNCAPGLKECRTSDAGNQEVWECKAASAETTDWTLTTTCPAGADCVNGLCVNPCQADIKLATNQGCDYYAIDLENSAEPGQSGTSSAADAQFAVIVSNPSTTAAVTVTVHETQLAAAGATVEVAPGGLEVIQLGPRNVNGTGKGNFAWRIKGNRPFVAYQFNPLDNVNQVFSNDASLLLPMNALDREYIAMTGTGGGPFVTVVGTSNSTSVSVTPSADLEAGDSVAATGAGETITVTLNAGEVLNLRAVNETGDENLTGTEIVATKDVVVFAGNVATTTGDRCCADHLEQQMFPTSVWGTTIVCAKSVPRQAEADHWRIVARDDGTEVSFSGGVSPTVTLSRGQFYDVATTKDFVVTASGPVLVGQFLASSFEILPDGVYCTSDQDCLSGVCSNGGSGSGRCVDTCSGAGGGCTTSAYCVDDRLLSGGKNAGTCLPRPCGAGLPSCQNGATCASGGTIDICVDTCVPGVQSCPAAYPVCTATNLCIADECNSDSQCPGGYCATFDDGSSVCRTACNPSSQCSKPGDACIPAGYAADESITVGICVDVAGCAVDSDCDPGHTCVIDPGASAGSCQPIGDPAFILAVPAEQFRKDYIFLAPNAYQKDYVNVIAPTDATALLDGNSVPDDQWVSIAGSGFKVARLLVSDGVHHLSASQPVGIVVYGYHDDVSYGYPGGANLFDLGE